MYGMGTVQVQRQPRTTTQRIHLQPYTSTLHEGGHQKVQITTTTGKCINGMGRLRQAQRRQGQLKGRAVMSEARQGKEWVEICQNCL